MEKLFTRIRVKLPAPPVLRQRGWLERLTQSIQEAQNKIVSTVVETMNHFTEDQEQEHNELKQIYY